MKVTEEQVRQWVRDELEQVALEKQDACKHSRSGLLNKDGSVTCDDCGKNLVFQA